MNALLWYYPGDAAALLVLAMAVQIAAVVAISWLLSRWIGRHNAAALYGVWLAALLCLPLGAAAVVGFHRGGVVLVALPVLEPELDAVANATADDLALDGSRQAWTAGLTARLRDCAPVLRGLFAVLALAWAAGGACLVVRTGRGLWTLAALRREMRPLASDQLGDVPEQVQRMLGMRFFPAVMTSRRVRSPISLGILRPVVVLPEGIAARLGSRPLRDVLIHECAHFLNRDHLVGILERIVQIAAWADPAVYILRRELDRAREEVCDNHVLRGGDVPCYARTLLEISQQAGAARPVMAATIGILEGPCLENRVAGMLDRQRKLVTRINRLLLATTAAAFFLAEAILAGVRLVPRDVAAVDRPQEDVVAMAAPEMNSRKAVAAALETIDTAAIEPPAGLASAAVHEAPPQSAAQQTTFAADSSVAIEPPVPKADSLAVEPSVVKPATFAATASGAAQGVPAAPVLAPGNTPVNRDIAAILSLQPAMRIERFEGNFAVALRLGEEPLSIFVVEPGKRQTIRISPGICENLTFEIAVAGYPQSDEVEASYRLTMLVNPETIRVWEGRYSSGRLGQWVLLTPKLDEAFDASIRDDGQTSAAKLKAGLFEVRKTIHSAVRTLSGE